MKWFARLTFASLLFIATHAHAADKFIFEKPHTKMLFFVSHLGFSNFIGDFTKFDGFFTFSENKPETSTIDVTIQPSGIRTDSPDLDKQLIGEDMFDAAKYPDVHFKSTAVKITGKNMGVVTGDLTIKDVTKPVNLNVEFHKCGVHPLTKQYVCGFTAKGSIKRSEYGLKAWEGFVGDEVTLHFEVEGVNEWRSKEKMKRT